MGNVKEKSNVCLKLFFVDASFSTLCNNAYWTAVQELNNKQNFDQIYTWDAACRPCIPEKLCGPSSDGDSTNPIHILNMLNQVLIDYDSNNVSFKLDVTTDGEVPESYISKCFNSLYDVVRNAIVSVNIYYIGRERDMNLGLNMIFGDSSDLSYYVNTIDKPIFVSTITHLTKCFQRTGIDSDVDSTNASAASNKDCFDIDQLLDPNLKTIIITRLGHARHQDNTGDEKSLLELRRAITSAFNRAKESDAADVKLQMKRAYAENDGKLYIDMLKCQLYDDTSLNNQLERRKCELLSYFDKHNRDIYQRIDRFVESKTQRIDIDDENDKADSDICWTNIYDDITFDKMNNLPCMPIKVNETLKFTLQLSAEELRHPLAFLANKSKRKLFATSFIEPYVIGYDTISKIGISRDTSIGNNRDIFTSPYSRSFCYPLIVSPRTIAHLKYNTAAISRLFDRQNDCALPGGDTTTIVLWNFVILWCAYERLIDNCQDEDQDAQDKVRVLWRELQSFCENFACLRFLSIKTSMSNEMVSLREALWFICWVVPQYAPNSAAFNQFLRRPFGYAIFDAYVKLCDIVDEDKLNEIRKLVDTWRVWSYMIDYLNDATNSDDINTRTRRLEYRVRAQWQQWLEHDKNELILLSGACAEPYPCAVNLSTLQPNVLWNMFELCKKRNLSRFHDLSSIMVINATKNVNGDRSTIYEGEKDHDFERSMDTVTNHVSINPLTGHTYVICRKTGLHWRECAGQYNVQRDSWFRLFNRFCIQYQRYPRDYLDLVAYLSRRYYAQQEQPQGKGDQKYDYVIDVKFLPIFEQIFKTFNESIIARMTVDKYLELYVSFCTNDGEQRRLELEQKKI